FAEAITLSLLLSLGAACSDNTPTTLLVDISVAPGVGLLDELRLSVFSSRGIDVSGHRLPDKGPPTLPNTVVLYSPAPGNLRLFLRGQRGSAVVAEGTAQVVTVAQTQTHTTLILEAGRRPDSDGDGVPDAIDDCPKIADPKQTAPCHGADSAFDAIHDAGTDTKPQDSVGEAPLADIALPDIIKRCTKKTDCDDGEPCTDDRCEDGLCTYGLTVCTYTGNPCQHPPSCIPKVGCVEATKTDGTACSDNLYCTVDERCQKGFCSTKPRDCQSTAPVCTKGTCNETKKRCTFTPLPLGTLCDDGNPCTQGDVCTADNNQPIMCLAPQAMARIIDSSGDIANRGSRTIVVDSHGSIHAIFSQTSSQSAEELRYATNASGHWVITTLDGPATDTGSNPSLAIDTQDRLHAVYSKKDTVIYRRWKVGATTPDVVEPTTAPDTTSSALIVDTGGIVHIARTTGDDLVYARRSTTGTWTENKAYTPTGSNDDTTMVDLALDASGHVHIAHGHLVSGYYYSDHLWHTSNETGKWVTITVSALPGAGHLPSIIIDSQGSIHIAHGVFDRVVGSGTLGLEARSSSPTASWTHHTLASGDQGRFPTLILGAHDHLHVVYQDIDKNRLLHLTNAKGSWPTSPTVIDVGSTDLGRWASAVRGANGRLHVLYEATHTGPVRYASFSSCQ
ncbi:MAG: hypothetical protein KAI47_20870, partial [Deltaproteobacteria bacterium]|nr:hypothetical protein [Deltaproteobacteria bacterium]